MSLTAQPAKTEIYTADSATDPLAVDLPSPAKLSPKAGPHVRRADANRDVPDVHQPWCWPANSSAGATPHLMRWEDMLHQRTELKQKDSKAQKKRWKTKTTTMNQQMKMMLRRPNSL